MARTLIMPAGQIPKTSARIVKDISDEMLETKEHIVLGMCGGRSIAGILEKLNEEKMKWKKIHVFFVDETSDSSNYKQAKELVIDKLGKKLPKANVHPIKFDADADDFGAQAYSKELQKLGGKFDIIILGVGKDGHVASIFPEHESAEDEAEHFIAVRKAPKEPKDRISASRSLLGCSKAALLLFIGEEKRNAYRKFLSNADEISCPAKLADWVKEAYIITDLR